MNEVTDIETKALNRPWLVLQLHVTRSRDGTLGIVTTGIDVLAETYWPCSVDVFYVTSNLPPTNSMSATRFLDP